MARGRVEVIFLSTHSKPNKKTPFQHPHVRPAVSLQLHQVLLQLLLLGSLSLHHSLRLSHWTHRSDEQRLSHSLRHGGALRCCLSSAQGQITLHLRPGQGLCPRPWGSCCHLQHSEVIQMQRCGRFFSD